VQLFGLSGVGLTQKVWPPSLPSQSPLPNRSLYVPMPPLALHSLTISWGSEAHSIVFADATEETLRAARMASPAAATKREMLRAGNPQAEYFEAPVANPG
jgi:hypothetical protein